MMRGLYKTPFLSMSGLEALREAEGRREDRSDLADLRLIPFLVYRALSDHNKERSERTTGTCGQSDI